MRRVTRAVRNAVRERARNCCEYCLRHEDNSPFTFNIEHIILVKHHGPSTLENLAWACPDCNISKGSDVGAYDPETRELVPLFHPRSQSWTEHFEMQAGMIHGKTAIGRATADVLQLNDPDRVETRQLLRR